MNKLRPETEKFLYTSHKYLNCREKMDAKYLEVDELQALAEFQVQDDSQGIANTSDGKFKSEYQQQSTAGNPIKALNELYEAARLVVPLFQKLVQRIVQESCDRCGESTDSVEVTLPDLKGTSRALEKARDDYSKRMPGPGISWVYDILRGSIHFHSAEQIVKCVQVLEEDPFVHIVTVKNRFSEPTLTGYRDLKVCFQLDTGEGFKHICELQIHHKAIKALNIELDSHSHYQYFRKYFAGGSASLEERLEDVKMICGESTTELNDNLLKSILNKDANEERLNRLGNLFLVQLCEYDWALQAFRMLLQVQIKSKGENTMSVARTYRKIGIVLSTKSELEEALQTFQKAARVMEGLVEADVVELAQLYNNMGHTLGNQDEYEESIEMLQKSLSTIKQAEGDQTLLLGDTHYKMGRTLMLQGSFYEAIEALNLSLDMNKVCLGDHHPSVANTCLYMGRTYHYLGYKYQDPDFHYKAGEQLEKALEIFKKAGGERHLGVAQTYLRIGFLRLDERKFELARLAFEKARELYVALFGEDHWYVAEIDQGLVEVENGSKIISKII